ncbi:MAG: GNAT family N-acetyltransferase [Pseudomonadota bacterium]
MTMDGLVIRPAEAGDLDALHAINEASTPGVGSVTRDRLEKLVSSIADLVLVALRGDAPVGFALLMVEGNGYDSKNYAWVAEHYPSFAYVDRVAVSEDARGLGVGALLYEQVIQRYSGKRPVLMAEVNLEPPNPGSLKFHKRHGFVEVGERWEDGDSKGVVYLERSLSA